MSFDKLMADLAQASTDQETMRKALPAEDGTDDTSIQAAAAEGGAQDDKGGDGKKPAAEGEGEGEGGDGKPMGKSFTVKLADGTEVEATDGAEMIKSLTERLDATETTMAKALGDAVGLIRGQADMIKSLGEQVTKLRGEGRGRKAVVSLNVKQDATALAKSDDKGLKPGEFMAKAMTAMTAGKITGMDIAHAESCLNRGEAVPAHIIQSVLA